MVFNLEEQLRQKSGHVDKLNNKIIEISNDNYSKQQALKMQNQLLQERIRKICNSGATNLNPILEEIDVLTNELAGKNQKIIELTNEIAQKETSQRNEIMKLEQKN